MERFTRWCEQMNRKRSITRRSSILKIDVNREDDTGIIGGRSRRSSRRVSFAEMCQIKEFPRDSPKVFKDLHPDTDCDGKDASSGVTSSKNPGITGLDKLLTGAIQTPYQDVTECPIPEMSSESFNIFDFNKTVLDPVDMETTQVGGSIDTFLPQMDFQTEPSMEIKFDASSLLQSLSGKPSDRLKTMQIYSPKRNNGQSITSQYNIMEHDKENVIPMEALPSLTNDDIGAPVSLDSKMFLQRFFGSNSYKADSEENEMEEMEETACVGDAIKMLSANNASMINNQNFEVTRYFDEDVTVGLEETKCVGGILDASNGSGPHVHVEKESSGQLADQAAYMEETRPVGGILKSENTTQQAGLSDTDRNYDDNVTKIFNMETDVDNGIEETRCVGGILSQMEKKDFQNGVDNKGMSERVYSGGNIDSVDKENILKGDKTVNFNKTDIGMNDNMEETKTLGGIVDKSINATNNNETVNANVTIDKTRTDMSRTVPMEETFPLGQINAEPKSFCLDKSVNRTTLSEGTTTAMEETKPVGGILKSADDLFNRSVCSGEDRDVTKYLSIAMEMTRPIGGFVTESKTEKTAQSTMEEMKDCNKESIKPPAANIAAAYDAEKTIDYTVPMEETRAVGKILEKTVEPAHGVENWQHSDFNKTIMHTVPIEETKTLGGILNKSADGADDLNFTKADDVNDLEKGRDTPNIEMQEHDKTMGIEETKCVGGILTNNMEMLKGKFENMYNHVHDKSDVTVIEPVQMEETKCVTGVIRKHLDENFVNQMENEKVCASQDKSDIDDIKGTPDSYDSNINGENIVIDEEISFKNSHKRNFDEVRGDTQERNEEKTKEITQTGLAKLKEMLILSKRKTAPALRQGDIRTPSKFSPLYPGSSVASASKSSCSAGLDFGLTRSPLHKRQRLLENEQEVEAMDSCAAKEKTNLTGDLTQSIEDGGLTDGLLETSGLIHGDVEGIDDEQMPDTMHIDLSASSASNETHSDRNSTNHSDPASMTVLEGNDTHLSGNDTRNCSNANLSLYSNLSNKSLGQYSFIAPDGPLSLKSFYSLTFTFASRVKGARCSAVFTPSIDMEDSTEVLHAELTLNPIVQAKKKTQDEIIQKTEKSEAGMKLLEKNLEDTQPQIFQLLSKASKGENQEINHSKLRPLMSVCNKEANMGWKQATKHMFEEALHVIQDEGLRQADEILDRVKSDSKSLDDLLTSLDDELESLGKEEHSMDELHQKQESLNREMETLSVSLDERKEEEQKLQEQLDRRKKTHHNQQIEVDSLKQNLLANLLCCEWNLAEFEEDHILFTFLNDKLELLVNLTPGVQEKQISNIIWQPMSSLDCRYFEDRVAVELAIEGINPAILKQKYTTISALPQLLHEVSFSINEIRRFCLDLEDVHLQHILKFENNSVFIELWDRKTLDMSKLNFTFNPSHPLTYQAQISVAVKMGNLKSQYIEDKLREISPGQAYLSRLITAVNFQQFHIDCFQQIDSDKKMT